MQGREKPVRARALHRVVGQAPDSAWSFAPRARARMSHARGEADLARGARLFQSDMSSVWRFNLSDRGPTIILLPYARCRARARFSRVNN